MTFNDSTRKRALKLLKKGTATLSEVSELVGTSRQLVRHWCLRAGINPSEARSAYLRRLWERSE